MDKGSLTYTQVEEAFAALERRRLAGQLSEDGYRQELNALRVVDEYGRTWMLQEGSGQWFVYHNETWMAATPPGRSSPPAAAPGTPVATEVAHAATSRQTRRPGCIGVTMRILLWDVVWVGLAVAVYYSVGQRMPWVFIPVGMLAAATLVLWVRRMGRSAHGGA